MEFYHVVLNGEIRPIGEAHVPLMSPALFSSFGVYETIEVVHGVAFHLEDHLARMIESTSMIEMDLPYRVEEMVTWARRLIREKGISDCRLRVVVLGASQPGEEVLVAMVPQPTLTFPRDEYIKGAQAICFSGQRAFPMCKSLNTLVNYLAQRQAARLGAREAILCSSGTMTEGSRSNIFAVHGGAVTTPPAAHVLAGITRDIVIRLAGELGIPVAEGALTVRELEDYDEFFVTSTSMHIMPIVAVDGRPIGSGNVGPVTAGLGARFEEYHRACVGG